MITHMKSVPVFISDQDEALGFYRDKLGLEVVADYHYSPEFRWLTLAAKKGDTEILLYRPAFEVPGASVEQLRSRVGTWTGITFLTDDIKSTYETLLARGVRFEGEPAEQVWGIEARFFDPDGNRFHLGQLKKGAQQ